MNINSIDLNLLIVFDSLYRTKSVSLAARELGLSQPAISHALKRLRLTLKDDLFTRGPSGMQATPWATNVFNTTSEILQTIESKILTRKAFNPRLSNQLFTLCATDNELLTHLNHLICDTKDYAPNLRFKLLFPKEIDFFQNMEKRIVDLSFGVGIPMRPNFEYEDIYTQEYKVICSKKLSSNKKISLTKYLSMDHILVSPLGGTTGPVDIKLEEINKSRRIALIVPSFSLIPQYLLRRDFIVTVPEVIAREFCEKYNFFLYDPPIAIDSIKMQMVWHKCQNQDDSHIWLREKVREKIRGMNQIARRK